MASITPVFADFLMLEALQEAERAAALGEVPVGAVVAVGERIIARAHNLTETRKYVGAHAEMLAIEAACSSAQNWRLDQAVLCVTLEPCTMCLGAIRHARIPTLLFGAGDSRQGAVGSLYDLSLDDRLGNPIKVIRHHMSDTCQMLLKNFFEKRRTV